MSKICAFILSSVISLTSVAQTGSLLWQKCYGGSGADSARSVARTSDGGFMVAGVTYSNDGNVTGNHNPSGNFSDVWVIKLDPSGTLLWQKAYGGSNVDEANSIFATSDGGAVITGWTESNDGDVTGLHGAAGSFADVWVLKIDSTGGIEWQKALGGSKNDYGQSVKQTTDGGFIVAGITYSNDNDVSGNHDTTGATQDVWVVKLDQSGTLQWQKCYGGSKADEAHWVDETLDRGYILTGETYSNDGNVTNNFDPTGVYPDYWLLKLNANGALVWQKCMGGTNYDQAYAVVQTTDSGYVMSGITKSNDWNVSNNHDVSHATYDEWIVKANPLGNMEWQFCYGGSKNDFARGIRQTHTGNLIVTGSVNSYNGDVTNQHDNTGATQDLWTLELNANGFKQWENCFGGTGNDAGFDVAEAEDDNFVEVGNTASTDGNVSGNHGSDDFWVIKVQSQHPVGINNVVADDNFVTIYPNPASQTVTVNSSKADVPVVITNTLGQIIIKETITGHQKTIDLRALPVGIYFLNNLKLVKE